MALTPAPTDLPGWGDLAGGDADTTYRQDFGGAFAAVPTLRLALSIIALAAIVTLYVGHIYATSSLLADVDRLRRENLELYLERNEVKAAFDRAAGPAVIGARARELGLLEAIPEGTPIHLAER